MESRWAENWIFSGDETEPIGRQLVREDGDGRGASFGNFQDRGS